MELAQVLKKQHGMNLLEIMVTMGIIGIISAMLIPMLLQGSEQNSLKAKQQNALESLHNAVELATTDMGLFPMQYGMEKIVTKKRIKAVAISNVPLSYVPTECKKSVDGHDVVAEGDARVTFPSGMIAVGLHKAWKNGEGRNGRAGDWICLYNKDEAVVSLFERETPETASTATDKGNSDKEVGPQVTPPNFIPTDNLPPASNIASQIQAKQYNCTVITEAPGGVPVTGATVTGTLSGISSGTVNGTTVGGGQAVFGNLREGTKVSFTASHPDYLPLAAPTQVTVNNSSCLAKITFDPGLTINVFVGNNYRGYLPGATISGTLNGVTNGQGYATFTKIVPGTFFTLYGNKAGYDQNYIQFVATNASNQVILLDATPLDIIYFRMNGSIGGGTTTINNIILHSLLGINQLNADLQRTLADAQNALNLSYYWGSLGNWGNVAAYQNLYNQYVVWSQYLTNQIQLGWNHHNAVVGGFYGAFGGNPGNAGNQTVLENNVVNFFDRNGNIVQYGYGNWTQTGADIFTAPDGSRYRQVAAFSTPIKISLKGDKARLDSNDKYLFDYDGFAKNNMPMIQPAGGLNPDEAWLVLDRKRNGIVDEHGILDGDDVFGDHVHKVENGYLDMGQVFQKSLKRDSEGKLYFEVKKLPWWEKTWIFIVRFFGYMPDPIPGVDLKLIDRQKHIYDASDYLQKVYVDYWSVDEWDKDRNNWIGQRAKVQFKDGHWSESVDQWFRIGFRLMPLKPDKSHSKQNIEEMKPPAEKH